VNPRVGQVGKGIVIMGAKKQCRCRDDGNNGYRFGYPVIAHELHVKAPKGVHFSINYIMEWA
jgi:hypothetical protein